MRTTKKSWVSPCPLNDRFIIFRLFYLKFTVIKNSESIADYLCHKFNVLTIVLTKQKIWNSFDSWRVFFHFIKKKCPSLIVKNVHPHIRTCIWFQFRPFWFLVRYFFHKCVMLYTCIYWIPLMTRNKYQKNVSHYSMFHVFFCIRFLYLLW